MPDEVETTPAQPEPVSADGEEGASPAEATPVQASPVPKAFPEHDTFWNYTDLALVMGLLIAGIVLIVGGVGAATALRPRLATDPGPLLLPTQIALYAFVYASFWADFKFRYSRPVLSSLGWRRANFNLFYCALGGIVLAFGVSLLASALHTPQIESPFDKLTTSPLSTALFGILAVGIGPFFEELFFRGFIQPLLSRSLGTLVGVLLTAILFGALHAPEYSWAWQYALAITLAGTVFGWLRAKTNSIIPPTVMHGCFNAVSFAALTLKHPNF